MYKILSLDEKSKTIRFVYDDKSDDNNAKTNIIMDIFSI